MPRDGSGNYTLPAGTTAVTGTTISSTAYNGFVNDIETDMNTARPISAGGTGSASESAARTALAVPGLADSNTFTGTTFDVTGVTNVTGTGGLLSRTIYTSGSGTYTVPSNVTKIVVEAMGGGGGGGGVDGQGANTAAVGGGAGAGGYTQREIAVSPAETFSYSVGSGGAGGASGANNGSSGNDTTFSNLVAAVTVSMSADGGAGGGGLTGTNTRTMTYGGSGGTASGGDFNCRGSNGNEAAVVDGENSETPRGTRASLGYGGKTMWGSTTRTAANGQNGPDAEGYGAGGSGGNIDGATSNYGGGDGAGGIIVIWEYN